MLAILSDETELVLGSKRVKKTCQTENIKIIGLLVGARGTITKNSVEFSKTFNLNAVLLKTISITALKYSIYILRNHVWRVQSTSRPSPFLKLI